MGFCFASILYKIALKISYFVSNLLFLLQLFHIGKQFHHFIYEDYYFLYSSLKQLIILVCLKSSKRYN